MSFDLFFCWQRQERIDFADVCGWARDFQSFEQKNNQLWYRDKDTGVYFSIDFEGAPALEGEGPEIPSGYFDTGLSFNLNFNRPSFFGHESLPIVEALCKRFGLSAFDPQAPDSKQLLLREVSAVQLLQSWLINNRNAIVTMIEHAGLETPPEMSPEQSMYRWKYSKNKKNLQSQCGDGIFVPTLSPIRRMGSKKVQLAFALTERVPCLVPDSDWVLVVRKKKQHFWSPATSDIGVLSAARFRELAAENLQPFESGELFLQVIKPENALALSKVIQKCEFELPRQEFEVLSPDEFVDIGRSKAVRPN